MALVIGSNPGRLDHRDFHHWTLTECRSHWPKAGFVYSWPTVAETLRKADGSRGCGGLGHIGHEPQSQSNSYESPLSHLDYYHVMTEEGIRHPGIPMAKGTQ